MSADRFLMRCSVVARIASTRRDDGRDDRIIPSYRWSGWLCANRILLEGCNDLRELRTYLMEIDNGQVRGFPGASIVQVSWLLPGSSYSGQSFRNSRSWISLYQEFQEKEGYTRSESLLFWNYINSIYLLTGKRTFFSIQKKSKIKEYIKKKLQI